MDTNHDSLLNPKRNLYTIYDDLCITGKYPNKYVQCTIVSMHDLSEVTLNLKDCWADRDVFLQGSQIGIVGVEKDEDNCITVDREHGFVILEPDTLVSITSITDRFCERKTVLANKLRFFSSNEAMLSGIIGHEMLSSGMLLDEEARSESNLFDSVIAIGEKVAKSSPIMSKAYGVGLNSEKLISTEQLWIIPVTDFLCTRYGGKLGPYQSLVINTVVDIEESVWNPVFGMKGKIDATVEVTYPPEMKKKKGKIPVEFKCGNQFVLAGKIEHIAQLQLYCLLMNEQYKNVTHGLLYYLKSDFAVETKLDRKIIAPLLMNRNRIVLAEKIQNGAFINIPKPILNPRSCQGCEYRTTCALLTRTKELHPLDEYINDTEKKHIQTVTYLPLVHLEFFEHWFSVITSELEIFEKKNNTKQLWTLPVAEREETGRCIGHMIFNSSKPLGNEGVLVCFERDTNFPFDFEKTSISVSEMVAVSSDEHYGMAHGFIQDITPPRLIIKLERSYSYFAKCSNPKGGPRLMIDKIQHLSPLVVQYEYLQSLMQDNEKASRLRKYLIDRQPATFENIRLGDILKYGSFKKYNKQQREVIVQALRTDSFLFVKGMPGTGKTRTIAGIVKFLINMKKTVLVTAQTSCGLDNILLNCLSEDINCFIRLGQPRIRDPNIIQRWEKNLAQAVEDYGQYKSILDEVPIVAATIFGLKHDLFRRRSFDYVIIDEASQALPSAVIGALLLAEKYIIVGDTDQLPSIVQSSVLKERHLPDNFFSMMATEHNTKHLSLQYRMTSPIMDLANKLVYEGRMTADPEAGSAFLKLDPIKDLLEFCKASKLDIIQPVLDILISQNQDDAVLFLDVESVERKVDKSIFNEKETQVAKAICQLYARLGVMPEEMAVIAPFRGQINSVRLALADGLTRNIDVNTVDVFQGQEKDVIICTFARTAPNKMQNGDDSRGEGLLEDVRRLNVAITRARRKLIMIGYIEALSTYSPFQKLFDILPANQIIKLA